MKIAKLSTVMPVVKAALRFWAVHLVINIINCAVTYMHYHMCYGVHANPLVSFVYSYVYSSSEYCVALSRVMVHTSDISRGMWHMVGASMCLEIVGAARLFAPWDKRVKGLETDEVEGYKG